MSTDQIREHDIVMLKDGRKGTVVSIYDHTCKPLAYLVEIDETDNGLVTVLHDEVQAVMWHSEKEE